MLGAWLTLNVNAESVSEKVTSTFTAMSCAYLFLLAKAIFFREAVNFGPL